MHRSASRLTRVLACAAVPVILVATGCSSDSGKDSGSGSGGDSGKSKDSASAPQTPTPKPTPTLEKAAFAKLPDPCKVVTADTVGDLVPEAKDEDGTASKSNDLASRATCSWNGLDEDGLKGSSYRWLAVSLARYDSHESLGSGNKRAEEQYAKQVEGAKATAGAKNVKVADAAGVGNQATTVTYSVKKGVDFFNQTVVARTENVVITLDYNGAAYEGAKAPDAAELLKDAIAAAKESVAAVAAANKTA
ncbi:DUF3558 family protein [Streptomyces bambusae]|uniref:DUF3558 family protein n=1 Tax=Streptomyces bambusae TaxID=1550616 RepID=UPI001CFFCD33|nr:DUF3558 family protein [Streptomyces bambusae]MCB5169237.1 DUF3558 family protein [Streptomyces bambusae]